VAEYEAKLQEARQRGSQERTALRQTAQTEEARLLGAATKQASQQAADPQGSRSPGKPRRPARGCAARPKRVAGRLPASAGEERLMTVRHLQTLATLLGMLLCRL